MLSTRSTRIAAEARAARRVRIALARRDVNVFASHVLRTETGAEVRQAPYHVEWHELASLHDRLIVESHVESGKTLQLAVVRTLFELGHDPTLRFGYVGASERMPTKTTGLVARMIERSRELREVFPHLRHADRQYALGSFRVERPDDSGDAADPSIQAIGVHGSFLGSRVDRLIIDDVLTQENTSTPHRRADVISWIRATVLGRLTARGRVIFITNAWHPDDAVRVLAREAAWTHRAYPVIDVATGLSAWPEQWPMERIKKRRDEIGPLEFSRTMMCQPYSDTETRFRPEWIAGCVARGEGRRLPFALERVPAGYVTVTGVDLGVSKRETAGRTVLFTVAVELATGQREVLDVTAGRWTVDEITRAVVDVHGRYRSTFFVENNAAQDFLVQVLQSRTRVPIRAHHTGLNKNDRAYGVESLGAELARGTWTIPSRGGDVAPSVQAWLDDMRYYAPGEHTGDYLMACAPPGELVTTRRGVIPIEAVVVGDEVLTHRARFRRVTGVTRRPYVGDMCVIRPSGVPAIRVTPEHPVWAADTVKERVTNRSLPGEWRWIDAGDIHGGRKTEGMFVLAPSIGGEPPAEISTIDLAVFADTARKPHASRWDVSDDWLVWRSETRLPRKLRVDEEFGLFLGLYIAEGSVGGRTHQVTFSLHEREVHLVEFVTRVARDRFGAETTVRRAKNSNGIAVTVRSTIAARLLHMFGSGPDKALMRGWDAWPLRVRLSIVRGWLMGDGHVAKAHTPHISAVTIARTWLEQAAVSLRQAGIQPTIGVFRQSSKFQGNACDNHPAWRMVLSERDTAALLADMTLVELDHWTYVFRAKDHTSSRAVPTPLGMAVRVASTEREPYAGHVFNMHIEDDESFTINGVAVHNCWICREGVRTLTHRVVGARAMTLDTVSR